MSIILCVEQNWKLEIFLIEVVAVKVWEIFHEKAFAAYFKNS